MDKQFFTNHELCEEFGMPYETWKNYKQRGWLPFPSMYFTNGHTLYTEKERQQIKQILIDRNYEPGKRGRKKKPKI